MKLKSIKSLTDIEEGDTLIITGDMLKNEAVKVKKVKVSMNDGTEIIFDLKKNLYFSLDAYLMGHSWVKEVKKVI